MTQQTQPMPGDAVIVRTSWWGAPVDSVGVINSSGEGATEYMVTFNLYGGRSFRGPSYGLPKPGARESVSASGGPCPFIRCDELTPAGKRTVKFWHWKDMPRAGGGVDYEMEVPAWNWSPDRNR